MGTPGYMGTGSATPHLTCNPPEQWVLDTQSCPGHPSQLLGCQPPNSPDLLQPSPTQPPGSCRAPQQPPALVGTWRLQSAAEHQLINPPVMTSLFLTRQSGSRELR